MKSVAFGLFGLALAYCDAGFGRQQRETAWKSLEEAQKAGKCKYIGVSNYQCGLLKEMEEYATVMPAVNQLELHPRFSSPELRELAAEMGVVLTGYGSGNSLIIEKSPAIAAIAKKVGKSPMQVNCRTCKRRFFNR